MSKLSDIEVEIVKAEQKARALREAIRTYRRVFAKTRHTQRDVDAIEQAQATLNRYGFTVPEQWRHFCW